MRSKLHFPDGEPRKEESQKLLQSGSVTIRIMEHEGPHDHSVELGDEYVVCELPCHSRKAKSKNKTTGEVAQAQLQASPILWVRIDPEYEMPKIVSLSQAEGCWIAALKGDRDVNAQTCACENLSQYASSESMQALRDAFTDSRLYFRVRAAAASSLLRMRNAAAIDTLIESYGQLYGLDDENGFSVRPNDFSSISDYRFFNRFSVGQLPMETTTRTRSYLNF